MICKKTLDRLALKVLRANVLEIRKVPKKVTNAEVPALPESQQPFLYASGNWGPIYLMIKGLVGWMELEEQLAKYLAFEVAERWPDKFHFVAANMTGGAIPGWEVAKNLRDFLGRPMPYTYIRETRKTGGQKELITGLKNNPNIPVGARAINMEELVNFAQTIVNGAKCLRDAGHPCNHGACYVYYDNPKANTDLVNAGIEMTYLFTVSELIEVADRYVTHSEELLEEYYEFRENPLQWQADRGLTHVQRGGTQ